MLNGVAPLLIFSFQVNFAKSLFKAFAGIPILGDILPTGIPIPIYLDENLTGIYVESESKAIDIETTAQARYDAQAPSVDQRGLSNLVTVNMLANRNSTMLAVILALNDMVFQRVVSKEYNVTYVNGSTTIFNGLLHGFSTQQGSDDDLVRIVLQISKSNLSPAGQAQTALPNITGATNLPRPPTT